MTRIITLVTLSLTLMMNSAQAMTDKPNILVIWGDDIGFTNVSAYSRGKMGYRTPNIDRIANEGALFTDHYAQPSCTAGRAAFVTGMYPIRSGLTTVGMVGSSIGMQSHDATIAEVMKMQGYVTGQFGKNHLGDRNEHLPTLHGFDEFFGNLYHLNTEEETEDEDYPRDPEFKKVHGPRGVLHIDRTPNRRNFAVAARRAVTTPGDIVYLFLRLPVGAQPAFYDLDAIDVGANGILERGHQKRRGRASV